MKNSAPIGVVLLEREGAGLSAQSRERAASYGYLVCTHAGWREHGSSSGGAAHVHAMCGARDGVRAPTRLACGAGSFE